MLKRYNSGSVSSNNSRHSGSSGSSNNSINNADTELISSSSSLSNSSFGTNNTQKRKYFNFSNLLNKPNKKNANVIATANTKNKNDSASANANSINLFSPPYESSWFEIPKSLEQNTKANNLKTYIKKLFQISKQYLDLNSNPDKIKAIIVPHAGIQYSGLCAAASYYPLKQKTKPIQRIVLFCTHHEQSNDIISTSYTHISPLFSKNNLQLDTKFIASLGNNITINNDAFHNEHSFYNQLPFIEDVAPDAIIIPFLISNHLNITHKTNQKIINVFIALKNLMKKKNTILICTSDFSHINGNYETKIKTNIYQNIRKQDNEIFQFIYDKLNGVRTRSSKIDDILFIQNAPSCGTMAMYLGMIFLNLVVELGNNSSSSDGSSGSSSDSSNGSTSSTKQVKKLYPRMACYYTSRHIRNIDIASLDIASLDISRLTKPINDLTNMSIGSVSYTGLVITTDRPIHDNEARKLFSLLTEFEKQMLNSYVDEYLDMLLTNQQHTSKFLSAPANSQIFKDNMDVIITVINKNNNSLRSCISSFNLQTNDNNLITNIRHCLDKLFNGQGTNYGGTNFPTIMANEINKLDFKLSIMSNIMPISINDYYGNNFVIGQDVIVSKNKNKYEYLFTNVERLLDSKINKKYLLDKLGGDTKKNNYKLSNLELYYYECLDV